MTSDEHILWFSVHIMDLQSMKGFQYWATASKSVVTLDQIQQKLAFLI